MSKEIFVFVECKDGSIRKVSYELLSKAKEISQKSSSIVYAVIIGSNQDVLANQLKDFADKVLIVDNEKLSKYRWDTFLSVMEQIIKKYKPYVMFGPSTTTGKDIFPRLAARLNGAIISDAVDVVFDENTLKIKKPLFGGKIISWIKCKDDSTFFVTFRPNSFIVENRSLNGELIKENIDVSEDSRIVSISTEKRETKKVDLQEADFIICGGRGMKGPEHFQDLEEIADIMGGRVGASRAVVDSKWRDYDDQVGKSGKTVSPKLYVGCGVSGALHHTMGMDTSKVIVAINKDPNALIFQYADYGIIDDVFNVLPALKEELKKIKKEI
ncbi:MAG TPA: electron transfer flavoprotein subunit alpha/FixB family protein [Syntrophorhabdaceae bacterium]|nr:electron transfer flavoprotein subunit alpha/FixB family protein [Pseudomonadota bacterium]HNQ63373.1 electron transfer flavoprotein subunit alpha/FixB family protein [Syntrophorhabdaceae bacterium]HNZ58878.1 electron transfer flavoprotein subunit alpha/FixB family protein [Syntrophorhabdaceae bacterium]HOG39873.1 electron transfer flavoprotein subunit alpha/FixB family protein [Syntrophorhabdaceae bacterium]